MLLSMGAEEQSPSYWISILSKHIHPSIDDAELVTNLIRVSSLI